MIKINKEKKENGEVDINHLTKKIFTLLEE